MGGRLRRAVRPHPRGFRDPAAHREGQRIPLRRHHQLPPRRRAGRRRRHPRLTAAPLTAPADRTTEPERLPRIRHPLLRGGPVGWGPPGGHFGCPPLAPPRRPAPSPPPEGLSHLLLSFP